MQDGLLWSSNNELEVFLLPFDAPSVTLYLGRRLKFETSHNKSTTRLLVAVPASSKGQRATSNSLIGHFSLCRRVGIGLVFSPNCSVLGIFDFETEAAVVCLGSICSVIENK